MRVFDCVGLQQTVSVSVETIKRIADIWLHIVAVSLHVAWTTASHPSGVASCYAQLQRKMSSMHKIDIRRIHCYAGDDQCRIFVLDGRPLYVIQLQPLSFASVSPY